MLEHMSIRPIIANSTPINNKIRIQIMPNNEQQLYTTYDMRYTKTLDTIAPLTPRNTSNICITVSICKCKRQAVSQRSKSSTF